MNRPPEAFSVAAEHGRWGEEVAAVHLRRSGYAILGRNVRPLARDRRCEIDIVALDRVTGTAVFVEVKQHAARDGRATRLRSITRRKCEVLRRACRAWLMAHGWSAGYRFDVIEVYGTPSAAPEIDHIERVRLFERPERFVSWAE